MNFVSPPCRLPPRHSGLWSPFLVEGNTSFALGLVWAVDGVYPSGRLNSISCNVICQSYPSPCANLGESQARRGIAAQWVGTHSALASPDAAVMSRKGTSTFLDCAWVPFHIFCFIPTVKTCLSYLCSRVFRSRRFRIPPFLSPPSLPPP